MSDEHADPPPWAQQPHVNPPSSMWQESVHVNSAPPAMESRPYPAYAHGGYVPQYPPPYPYPAPSAAAASSSSSTVVVGGHYRRFPHGFHLLMTCLTCGLWAPIWLILWAIDKADRR